MTTKVKWAVYIRVYRIRFNRHPVEVPMALPRRIIAYDLSKDRHLNPVTHLSHLTFRLVWCFVLLNCVSSIHFYFIYDMKLIY
jgi:hypothetical protein